MSAKSSAPKNISVFLRVRPPIPREKNHTFKNIRYNDADKRIITIARSGGEPSGSAGEGKEFVFNEVFRPNCSQKAVYEAFGRRAVSAAFDGEHGVLFVYGQTGSGKTYTISNDKGPEEEHGVLQQAMREMWARIETESKEGFEFQCFVSYVQLYNEILTDLLDEKKARVRIQMGPEGRGDVVLVTESSGDSIQVPVRSYEDTMALFHLGMERKEMTSTAMNATSSRSHTIFTVHMLKTTRTDHIKASDGSSSAADQWKVGLEGRVVLCDLAGSERVSKTHAEGKALGEASHINGSLLVLGKVVAALTDRKGASQHAPFRESKLTRILQYSLLGNGNTSIVVNCSPSDDNTEETLSAAFFGLRAIQIKQEAKRHETLDYKALYLQLMADIDAKRDHALADVLNEERAANEGRVSELEMQLSVLQDENTALRTENQALKGTIPPEEVAKILGKDTTQEWKDMVKKLKQMYDSMSEKYKTLSKEHQQLALVCAQAKMDLFELGKRAHCTRMQYSMDYSRLTKRIDELTAELSAAKGVEYMSTSVGGLTASYGQNSSPMTDTVSVKANSTPSHTPRSPGDSLLSENMPIEQEMIKSREEISELRRQIDELRVYQRKSVQAIRFLAAENETLRAKAKMPSLLSSSPTTPSS